MNSEYQTPPPIQTLINAVSPPPPPSLSLSLSLSLNNMMTLITLLHTLNTGLVPVIGYMIMRQLLLHA